MPSIVIKAEYALRAQGFISKDPSHRHLGGFYVHAHPTKGAYIVATNGAVLGLFYDEHAVIAAGQSGIVDLDKLALAACKPEKYSRLTKFLAIDLEAGVARVTRAPEDREDIRSSYVTAQRLADTNDMAHIIAVQGECLITGTFPPYDRALPVYPATPKAGSVSINPALLKAFIDARGANASTAMIISISDDGEKAPMIVKNGSEDFFGVLMPLRHNHELALPAWLDIPSVNERQAAAGSTEEDAIIGRADLAGDDAVGAFVIDAYNSILDDADEIEIGAHYLAGV